MSLQIEPYKKQGGSRTFYHAHGYMGTNQKTGERKYFNRQGFKTKAAAKDAFELATAKFKEQTTQVSERPRIRFEDVCKEWWRDTKLDVSESTQTTYEGALENHVNPAFGKLYVDAIEILDAEHIVKAWARKFAGWRCYYNLANRIMKFSVRAGYIKQNPFE